MGRNPVKTSSELLTDYTIRRFSALSRKAKGTSYSMEDAHKAFNNQNENKMNEKLNQVTDTIEEVPFDDVTETAQLPAESTLPSFNELVQRELVKYESVIPKVEELKAEYMALAIVDIDDIEGYDKVAKGLRFIVSQRTAIEAKRAELKKDSLEFGKKVDARAKEITALIAPIEEHLKKEKERIDTEKKLLEEKAELDRKEKVQARHDALSAVGMYLLNDTYVWQSKKDAATSQTLHRMNLETFSDEDFETERAIVEKLDSDEKLLLQQEDADRATAEKKLADEKQALADEQKQMREERLSTRKEVLDALGFMEVGDGFTFEGSATVSSDALQTMNATEWASKLSLLKEQQTKIKNEKEEAEKAKLRFDKRCKQLVDLDMSFSFKDSAYVYGEVKVHNQTQLLVLEDADWGSLLTKTADDIEKQKLADKEKEKQRIAQEARVTSRRMQLAAIGMSLDFSTDVFSFESVKVHGKTELAVLDDAAWDLLVTEKTNSINAVKFEQQKAEQQKLDDEEKEKQAGLSDKQRFVKYMAAVSAVPAPELTTAKWKGLYSKLQATIAPFKQ